MDNRLEKKYGLPTAVCMVVGIVIGSGVFFKAETVLNKTGGNKSKAAELLGITREGLRKKLLRMGINDKELPHDDGKA